MEQLIFFAIIIIFSILDSVARSRKKKQQQAGSQGQTSRLPEEWSWEEEGDVATYDEEPSYEDRYQDERVESGREPLSEYTNPYGSGSTSKPSTKKSSEAMIPSDIWEEIAGLARGRIPEPKPAPPPPVEPVPARPITTHEVHRAHAGYGTDPSTRTRSEQDGLDPMRSTLSKDARAVRQQLKSHSRSQLRRAIILQELLGPPASMRPDLTEEK
jgi:hypothetical protein